MGWYEEELLWNYLTESLISEIVISVLQTYVSNIFYDIYLIKYT